MSHLDYYKYQAVARGVHTREDIIRGTQGRAYLYNRLILPWLPEERTTRIVELACGHGSFLHWLHQHGYTRLSGIDSSREQIELALLVADHVVQMEAISWLEQQSPASINVLVAIDFIEHISKDDFMRLLKAAVPALAPNGRLILRYPNGDSPFVGLNLFNDITHVWTYTTNCLQSLGRMHGFNRFLFVDEGPGAIRDHRWLKVPIARFSSWLVRGMIQVVTRERINYWHSNIWACLQK